MMQLNEERAIITRFLIESARKYPHLFCMKYLKRGEYVGITWEEVFQVSRAFALGFQALGVGIEGRVALMSKTRYEWRLVDYGILLAGGTTVTLYPSLTDAQVEYIINDSDSEIIVVDRSRNLAKVLKVWEKCPKLKYVIHISPVAEELKKPNVLSLDDLIRKGEEFEKSFGGRPTTGEAYEMMKELESLELKIEKSYDEDKIREMLNRTHELDASIAEKVKDPFVNRYLEIKDENICTIVYTSGTTGVPKGALLSHHNMGYNAVQTHDAIPLEQHDVSLSFLPLSHVLERQTGQFVASLIGFTVAYARDTDSLIENLNQVKPTFMTSVPRVYEKLYDRIIADILEDDNESKEKK